MFLFKCPVCLTGEDEIVSLSVQEELSRGVYNPFSNFLPPNYPVRPHNHDALPWPHPLSVSIGWWDQRVERGEELGTRTSGWCQADPLVVHE